MRRPLILFEGRLYFTFYTQNTRKDLSTYKTAHHAITSLLVKELCVRGKITVFTFLFCPHITMSLDLLPYRRIKIRSTNLITWLCVFVASLLCIRHSRGICFCCSPVHRFFLSPTFCPCEYYNHSPLNHTTWIHLYRQDSIAYEHPPHSPAEVRAHQLVCKKEKTPKKLFRRLSQRKTPAKSQKKTSLRYNLPSLGAE